MTGKTITIIGIGLLGGSYAMGLTTAGNTVYGIDIKKESIDYAINKGYIKSGSTNKSEYIEYLGKSDLIVIAIYPKMAVQWIAEHIQFINTKAVITDLCGVKQCIVEDIQKITEPYNIEFYGSHPMRGKEVLGVENADSNIFKDANMILTPTEANTSKGEEIITDMAKTLGFTVITKLNPKEHDQMIGYVSQLTHAIAVSLMTAKNNENLVEYTGDSFRDLTRIAKIDEYLWSQLFISNKDALVDEIDVFIEELNKLKGYIKEENTYDMQEMFRLSTKRRKKFDR